MDLYSFFSLQKLYGNFLLEDEKVFQKYIEREHKCGLAYIDCPSVELKSNRIQIYLMGIPLGHFISPEFVLEEQC